MADTLDTCARELLEVMPLVMQHLRQTMREQVPQDLRVPELRTLAFLRHNTGSNLTDLAEYIGISLPSMSKLVDNLTYRGFVSRQPDAVDRRRIRLSLTDSGATELAAARKAAKAAFVGKLTQLDRGDIDAVTRSLHLLRRLFVTASAGASAPRRADSGLC